MSLIRTIDDYADAVAKVLPRGRAWPEARGPVWLSLLRSLAPELHRTDTRMVQLIEEADPRTCVETLEDWERVLGLPDPCAPENFTFDERRNAVIAQLRARGGASVEYFTGLAADRGYEVEIAEHRPFTCGRSRCGRADPPERVGPPTMRHVWSVALRTPRLTRFRCGNPQSRCGRDPLLRIERAEEIECLFDRLKPAHSTVVYDYSNDVDLVALAAMVFDGDTGLTLGAGNRVEAWASGGLQNITMTGSSEHITAGGGVVSASPAGSGNLLYDTIAPLDLPLGFSAFVACRVPDVDSVGASNRLFMLYAGAPTVFNAIMPVASGTVQLTTNGGNVTAPGLSEADLETFAVWGFVVDLVAGTGRILRNGVTLASGPLTADFSGVTRYRALLNAALEVQGALLFDRGSVEIDAAATAHLRSRYGI